MERLSRLALCFALCSVCLSGIDAQGAPPVPAAPAPSPKFVEAQRLITQQKFAEAVPLLREVLQAQPGSGPAWMSLGAAHRGLRMADSAAAAYERASKLPGVARQAVLQLVLLHADRKQNDHAFRWFQELRRNAPDFSGVARES